MNLKNFTAFFILCLGGLSAQTFSPQFSTLQKNENVKVSNTINILAVMVEFQPDKFELTYGDGTFGTIYSKDYGNSIIDPLPHDKNYFEDHLKFAENYYNKSSNGIVEINYNVIPEIVKVSKFMREYSPDDNGGFKILGDFATEVWTLAEQQNPDLDFSQYDLFMIFHAGVGKDISTSNLLGEPRDLPSIFISLNSLKQFYGNEFDGITLSNGFKITNSAILPETESREESGFGGTVLLELSINGLIVSNIASYLGLPDLFDAETGKSAIGRFGLMDGQSLFAFGGLFPPEPSAWEKVFLGWEIPVTFDFDKPSINVVTRLAYALNREHYKIVKIPINSSEYYLIENRQRDANKDGVKVTYKTNSVIKSTTFQEDIDEFNNAIIDTLNGVVLDVDEFDWATPGNGILIWHIDEKIINENLSANKINVGKNRGVDLEEADGIQDIGEEFQTIFGDIVIAEGDSSDFWFASNPSKLYKNIFSSDSKPNTKTNSGANSLITISNFADFGNEMTFSLNFGSDKVDLISRMENFGEHSNLKISKKNPSKTFTVQENGLVVNFGSLFIPNFSDVDFALVENRVGEYVVGSKDSLLNIFYYEIEKNNERINIGEKCTSPIVINQINENESVILVGLANGAIKTYRNNIALNSAPVLEETIQMFDSEISQIAILENQIAAISKNKFKFSNENEISFPEEIKNFVLTKNKSNKFTIIILTSDNSIFSFIKGDQSAEKIYSSENEIDGIAICDLRKNGENYIVFNSGNQIQAINFLGTQAENFPYQNNSTNNFIGIPNVADINNDENADIISLNNNGDIYAISGTDGKIISEFPLSTGGEISRLNIIIKRENDLLLSATSSKNEISNWSINSLGEVQWGSKFGNNLNSASINSAKNENYISEFFPQNKTYNWPNPVYENETFIRTYVSEDSKVIVKIFDLAGDLVDEFNFNAVGGLDSEYSWNVTNIQSGAYLAHLEVTSNSGKSESKIIKIAIVK
ncbi:MAG: T9SS type A sorting domain-containing protein [Ignavibacteriae bacterium]|nr:T9SS type A sorting domain-containing protein [Ignavibacteriota bacterium]